MKAFIRQAIRRWRTWIERKTWRAKKPLRKPSPQIAALDPLIVQARKAHKPRKSLYQKRQELAHDQLRKGMMQ